MKLRKRHVASAVLAAVLGFGAARAEEIPKEAQRWRWSHSRTTLAACAAELKGLEIALVDTRDGFFGEGKLRVRVDGKVALEVAAHKETAVARLGKMLFVSEHHPISSGCAISAYDLDTGGRLWRTQLHGIGRTSHSKYRNNVQLEVVDGVVIIRGEESHGRYVEILAAGSGKVLRKGPPAE